MLPGQSKRRPRRKEKKKRGGSRLKQVNMEILKPRELIVYARDGRQNVCNFEDYKGGVSRIAGTSLKCKWRFTSGILWFTPAEKIFSPGRSDIPNYRNN